jgi:hypothetical protein
MESMTPEEALQLLDNVSGQAAMNRPDHIKCQTAVNILRRLVQDWRNEVPKADPKPTEPKKP